MKQEVKQWRWKINHASKGVVVNGSGNGISWITWTQGKKGARSISEKDQAPGAPLRQVSNLCIYWFVFLSSQPISFRNNLEKNFEFHGVVGSCYVIAKSFISFMLIML
jgi:hypothetical protein